MSNTSAWGAHMDIDVHVGLAWATWMGRHALPVFVVLLMGVLTAVAVTWWGVRRPTVPQERGEFSPVAYLAVHLALGFALLVSAAVLFAVIAEALAPNEGRLNVQLGQLDEAFIAAWRDVANQRSLQVFSYLTNLGDPATLTALCVTVALALIWRRRWMLAVGWVVAIAGNAALNVSLKMAFARVRPVHEHGWVTETGFSFPSGHSSGAVVAYGMLAYLMIRHLHSRWQLVPLLVCTSIACTVGASRVFLQVHYPSDVVAGFSSGMAWLAVCIISIELLNKYSNEPTERE